MRPTCFLCCSIPALWLIGLAPNHVAADAPEPRADRAENAPTTAAGSAPRDGQAQASVEVGRPKSVVKVWLTRETGQIVLHAGKAHVVLPLVELGAVQTQSVSMRDGAVGIIRVAVAGQQIAALVTRAPHGAVEIVWTGRLDLHGDPGDRSAAVLEVGDRDGDGSTEIVVGRYDERIRVCGQERTVLEPRAVDPRDFVLRPMAPDVLSKTGTPDEAVVASDRTPGPTAPPILKALRLGTASVTPSQGGASGNLMWLRPGGSEDPQRNRFVTLRWAAPKRPIRSFAVLVSPTAAKLGQPHRLSVVGDKGQQLSVQLPAELRPDQRYWFTPKEPWQTACVSIAIEDAAATGSKGAAQPPYSAIEAYTDLDFDGGLPRLIDELVQEGAGAAEAADLLEQIEADVTAPLLAAWPRLQAQGRRRVVRIAAPRAKHDPSALGALAQGLRDEDAGVFDAALRAAIGALPASQSVLLAAAAEAGKRGDATALTLARSAPAQALEPLLDAILQNGGSERAGLRLAAAIALEHGGETGASAAQRWAEQNVRAPIAGRAAATLALASVAGSRALAAMLLRASYAEAREFPDQWRLVAASATLPADIEIDAWLAKLAKSADPWMLRAAALQALQARSAADARSVAAAALEDPYPRVRATAIGALASRPDSSELLSRSARNDKWFLVRSAAVSGLAAHPEAQPVILAAVGDRSALVRAAAIHALGSQHAVSAWPTIAPHADDAKEYPEVIAEAVAFAKAQCVKSAGPALQQVVVRGLRPDAWGPDQDLALRALEALSALGGESASWAAQRAKGSNLPEPVRAAAAKAAKADVVCKSE